MGKGDKKTKKGKLTIGSFGKLRKRVTHPAYVPKAKPTPKKKAEKK